MVMILVTFRLHARQLRDVEHLREIIEVKHRIVLAVLAIIGRVFAEPHVFQIKSHEASIAALYALAEFQTILFRAQRRFS
jgi:hypothetical protein